MDMVHIGLCVSVYLLNYFCLFFVYLFVYLSVCSSDCLSVRWNFDKVIKEEVIVMWLPLSSRQLTQVQVSTLKEIQTVNLHVKINI